ncbi:MAG: class I SAM-dependent methyltransferase [Cuspidothrix sp.]
MIKKENSKAYETIDEVWESLSEFLGNDFNPMLTNYQNCCEFCDQEFARLRELFYHESLAYLYDLTHFHFLSYKDRFFSLVEGAAQKLDLQTIADFGCGVGLDGQMLIKRGLNVSFIDFYSPCTEFLKWRLAKDMNLQVEVLELYKTHHKYDLAYAVDVLEHIPDPNLFLDYIFKSAHYVCINLFPHDLSCWDSQDMHLPLNHWQLYMSCLGTLIQVDNSGDTVVTLWKSKDLI